MKAPPALTLAGQRMADTNAQAVALSPAAIAALNPAAGPATAALRDMARPGATHTLARRPLLEAVLDEHDQPDEPDEPTELAD